MGAYSADQVVGKQLIARRPIELKRQPSTSAETVYTVPIGGNIGTVYSWTGGTGGQPLWWMFYDQNQKTYYVLHNSGAFDVGNLRDQGALTVEEVVKEEKEKAKDAGGLGFPNPFGSLDLKKPLTIGIMVVAGALAFSLLKSK